MSRTGQRRGGRPWRRLVAYVLERDGWICGLCGHPGADTGGHLTPVSRGGEELDPDNVRAEHGERRTLERDGYDCTGNYGQGNRHGPGYDPHTPTPRDPPPSRVW